MSQISFHNAPQPPLILRGGGLSEAQLQLHAALGSFSAQATDTFSIASMTLAGFAGRIARVGILSSGASNFFSQIGSVAAEAGTITLLQNGWHETGGYPSASSIRREANRGLLGDVEVTGPVQDFFKHFVNFAVFRLTARTGAACCAPTHHFIQSAAMMAGHQTAAFLKLEETSQASLSQQFFDANLATLQISVGSALASGFLAGRLQQIERKLEAGHLNLFLKSSPYRNAEKLFQCASQNTPTPPEGFVDPLSRIARIQEARLPEQGEAIQKVQAELERQIKEFQDTTDTMSSFLTRQYLSIVMNRNETRNGCHLLNMHSILCGRTNKGLLGTIEVNGRTEGLPNLDRMLAERLSFFASHIVALEKCGQADTPKIQNMRELIYTAYDQLQLIRESLRLVMRFSPQDETPYYQAIGNAYKGFRRNVQNQVERVRAVTQATILDLDEQAVEGWAETFLATCIHPRAALNAQIIRGRVNLFHGEIIRGNFYEALKDCPTQPIKVVRVLFDPVSGQVVAFYDRRGQAEDSRLAFQQRNINLQEALLYVDPVESGEITHVQTYGNISSQAKNALEKLVGFQVLPSHRILAYENRNNRQENNWHISFLWHTCEDPTQLYTLKVSKPVQDGTAEHQTEWHLFTLDCITHPDESVQLWVPKGSFRHDQLTRLVKAVKRVVKVA